MAEPKIIFYTSPLCPWAHRAQITLKELGLQYEEVIIDLAKPREPWYLETVNPLGLVPALSYNGEVITESKVITQFLADAHPSHLVPGTGNSKDALTRARISLFVETWFSKAGSHWRNIAALELDEKEKLVEEFVDVVAKQIDPLLKDAAPFFGGSGRVTLAEALTAPFILRLYSLSEYDIFPKSLVARLNTLPNFSKWAAEVVKQENVKFNYSNENVAVALTWKWANPKVTRSE